MKKIIYVFLFLFSTQALMAQTKFDENVSAVVAVPQNNNVYQTVDGTCYAHTAIDYINSIAGLTGDIRFRPLSSLIVLSLNEESPYLQNVIVNKFFVNAESIFDGGYTSNLINDVKNNLESLIPISSGLEILLGVALPFSEAPRSIMDHTRVRNVISKKFFKQLVKALNTKSLKTETENYLISLERIGLTMDYDAKTIVYSKPALMQTSKIEDVLVKKKLGTLVYKKLNTKDVGACISTAHQIIYSSLKAGHPVALAVNLIQGYHAMLIYQITPTTKNDYRILLKNSWKDQPTMVFTLKMLCSPLANSSLEYTKDL